MTTVNTDLRQHIQAVVDRWSKGLERCGYDAVWIAAGDQHMHFQDDHGPAFQANPYFTQLVDPDFAHAGAQCLIQPGRKPQLFLLQPIDYWHAPSPLPEHLNNDAEINVFNSEADLHTACQTIQDQLGQTAYVGEDRGNENPGTLNDERLISYMDFHRAVKTPHELNLMRQASEVGVRGHMAARSAFGDGCSEFEIHMAYLQASQQTDLDVPYANIVALNEHGATLHYQHQERTHPDPALSLLIDAGGTVQGYASDITRTYAADPDTLFASLISLMQTHQDHLLGWIRPGISYADLHEQMHRNLAKVLVSADLVTCSAEAAFTQGITEKFCPHGLGHLLGIQVHDVGGHLADDNGTQAPPAPNYPSLRFTRTLSPDQVFTIEPGLYFIDPLLEQLRQEKAAVNWTVVDKLKPFGGIRIEDNVRVLSQGIENLTRDAWSRVTNV